MSRAGSGDGAARPGAHVPAEHVPGAQPGVAPAVVPGVWWRWPVLAAGLAALAYGLLLLGTAAPLIAVAVWLAGGLLVHDGLLAPLALLAGTLLRRRVGAASLRVVAAGLLVATCLVVVALPALGTPGVPDNPTTTPRDYGTGLAALLALDAAVTAALVLVVRRRGARH